MDEEDATGWPTGATVVVVLVAFIVGSVLGWFAHGLMMHRMMGNRGMMGSMMHGSSGEAGMDRSAMRDRCRGMMGNMDCPMMQAPADTTRHSPEELESSLPGDLDDATRQWVQSIRGDASPEDARGADRVTVNVGAGEQGLAFGSPVLRVDPGTTVTFRWTGRGGIHNVNFLDSDRKSSLTYEEGNTYEVTLEESGVYRYVCVPHRTLGMKGIVIVE